MAITVKEDVIFLSRARQNLEGGAVIARQFKVSGVEDAGLGKAAIGYRATLVPGIPKLGDAHPVIDNCFAVDITADPVNNSPGQITIVVTYQDLTVVRCSVNGNVVRETTRLDRDAKLIKVGYKNGNKPAEEPPENDSWIACEPVEILRPGLTLAFDFWLAKGQENYADPYKWIKKYQGKINSLKWQGGGPRSWLCTEVSVSENYYPLEKRVHRVTLGFVYRERFKSGSGTRLEWWEPLVFYTHPYTRQTPYDVDPLLGGAFSGAAVGGIEGNGWIRTRIYEEENFHKISNLIPKLFGN